MTDLSCPYDPVKEGDYDRCLVCARARQHDDLAATLAHRMLPVLSGVDKIEYADGSVYIGKSSVNAYSL